MTAPVKLDGALEASVASTFDTLSWEIELAGARCLYLDKLIGDLMPTLQEQHRQALMEGMHAVDLLAQHLTNLSAFARRMSESVSSEMSAPVDAAIAEITLGALADRMATAFGAQERGAEVQGDLDLF